MAYLDATGRISGVTVLNHCVNSKEPASQQQGAADKWEEGRNFVHKYIWRTPTDQQYFQLCNFQFIFTFAFVLVFFNPAHKYIPVK
jgi:hypothetical protein